MTDSFVGTSLGLAVVVVIVAIVAAVVVNRNGTSRTTGPGTYFLFGVSLVSLATGLSTSGVAVHAASQLVGPTPAYFPANFPGPYFPLCPPGTPGPSTTVPASPAASVPSTTVVPSSPSQNPQAELGCTDESGNVISEFGSSGGVGFSTSLLSTDDATNHFISVAVAAGLFALVALLAFGLAWRRARRLVDDAGLGNPPVGRLPLSYSYLIAGLATISLLVFVPITADSIFRAIAPGVNETSGHADGIRNLVTFFVLSVSAGAVVFYHLRYAARLREEAEIGGVPGPDEPEGEGSEEPLP